VSMSGVTRLGDAYGTVIIDLTGIRDATGPFTAAGHGGGPLEAAFETWPAARGSLGVINPRFRGGRLHWIQDCHHRGIAGPDRSDGPGHAVGLAGDALDRCRRRVQHDVHGHRGRTGDSLFSSRRMLHTGTDLLTDKQRLRLQALFGSDEHVEVEATWTVYQRLIAAYRDPDRSRGMSSCAH